MSMRLRHTSALALVGWYLMIPPSHSSGSNSFEVYPPLWEWSVYSAYDSAHECEGAKFFAREAHKTLDDPMHQAFERAQCIASDDRRLSDYPWLKEK